MSSFFTLEQAQTALQSGYDAILKAQGALEYRHEGPQLSTVIKRQSLSDLQDNIDYWINICEEIESGSSSVIISQMVPLHE